jgi:hypothetical protein
MLTTTRNKTRVAREWSMWKSSLHVLHAHRERGFKRRQTTPTPQRERVSVGFVGDPPAQMGEENIVQCPQDIWYHGRTYNPMESKKLGPAPYSHTKSPCCFVSFCPSYFSLWDCPPHQLNPPPFKIQLVIHL